jgi:hypothetical protein
MSKTFSAGRTRVPAAAFPSGVPEHSRCIARAAPASIKLSGARARRRTAPAASSQLRRSAFRLVLRVAKGPRWRPMGNLADLATVRMRGRDGWPMLAKAGNTHEKVEP